MGLSLRLSLAALAANLAFSGAALAQQHIDEPRLDPIFGRQKPKPQPISAIEDVSNDEAFDQDGFPRFRRPSGLVGIMTFLTPDSTNLSLGVGPVYKPDYFGSNDYEWDVDPSAYVRFQNFVFLDDNGADFAIVGFSNFSFGPTLRIISARKEEDNADLRGLGDVGTTVEFGGFAATTWLDRYSVRFKARHGIATGHRGTIVDAAATALLFRYGDFSTSISAETTWIGERYADAYFSVTPDQAARSGYRVYDADRGFRDIGGSFNGYINVRRNWSLNPYVKFSYIFPGIADTPIIADRGDRQQWIAGFHILREFQFGRKKR